MLFSGDPREECLESNATDTRRKGCSRVRKAKATTAGESLALPPARHPIASQICFPETRTRSQEAYVSPPPQYNAAVPAQDLRAFMASSPSSSFAFLSVRYSQAHNKSNPKRSSSRFMQTQSRSPMLGLLQQNQIRSTFQPRTVLDVNISTLREMKSIWMLLKQREGKG